MKIGNLTNTLLHFSLVLSGSFFATQSIASELQGPPELPQYDEVGVNLASGYATISLNDVSIGTGASALSHTISNHNNFFWGFLDDYSGGVVTSSRSGNEFRDVQVGHSSQKFRKSGSSYTPVNQNGASLVYNGNGIYTYTMRDGTIAVVGGSGPTKITKPNGYEITIHRSSGRIQSVTSNTGLQLKYTYRRNSLPSNPTADQHAEFMFPVSVISINNAKTYCSPTANSCSGVSSNPKVEYTWPTFTQMFGVTGSPSTHYRGTFKVKEPSGAESVYVHRPYSTGLYNEHFYEPRIIQIKSSSSTGPYTSNLDYAHYQTCVRNGGSFDCSVLNSNVVYRATIGSTEWTYNYPKPSTPYMSGTNYSYGPEGTALATMDNYGMVGGTTSFKSKDGHEVYYMQNDRRLVERVVYPEGYEATFGYDDRGNLTRRTDHGGRNITTEASYPATGSSECNNKKLCNKPKTYKDAKGKITNFTYDASSGQISKKTLPAVDGVRAETRYFYANRYAYYKNSQGNYVQAATPVRLLVKESYCKEGAASGDGCANSSHEVVTEYDYGPNSGPNNLWLRSALVRADGVERRTCFAYDDFGNKIAETEPKFTSSCY